LSASCRVAERAASSRLSPVGGPVLQCAQRAGSLGRLRRPATHDRSGTIPPRRSLFPELPRVSPGPLEGDGLHFSHSARAPLDQRRILRSPKTLPPFRPASSSASTHPGEWRPPGANGYPRTAGLDVHFRLRGGQDHPIRPSAQIAEHHRAAEPCRSPSSSQRLGAQVPPKKSPTPRANRPHSCRRRPPTRGAAARCSSRASYRAKAAAQTFSSREDAARNQPPCVPGATPPTPACSLRGSSPGLPQKVPPPSRLSAPTQRFNGQCAGGITSPAFPPNPRSNSRSSRHKLAGPSRDPRHESRGPALQPRRTGATTFRLAESRVPRRAGNTGPRVLRASPLRIRRRDPRKLCAQARSDSWGSSGGGHVAPRRPAHQPPSSRGAADPRQGDPRSGRYPEKTDLCP